MYKKKISVNSTGHDHDASFCNTRSDFYMEKTAVNSFVFMK